MGLAGTVAITGLGVVSALGCELQSHYKRLLDGESALSEFDADGDLPPVRCARVRCDYIRTVQNRMLRKLLQPSAAMAVVAAGTALESAKLDKNCELLRGAAVYLGSVSFEMAQELFTPAVDVSLNRTGRFDFEQFAQRGLAQLDPLLIVKGLPNAGLCGIAIEYGVLGSNLNITNGSIGGMQALMEGAAAVWRGEERIVIAGGYDSLLQSEHIAQECVEGLHRDLGEGAAICILESIESARERGAHVYAEIVAVAEYVSRDGEKPGTSLAVAGREACREACEANGPARVVFGDLAGNEARDEAEIAAVSELVGEGGAITNHTGATGFTGAAHGVFSFVHAAMSLQSNLISPIVSRGGRSERRGVRLIRQSEQCVEKQRIVWHRDSENRAVAIVLRKAE